MTTPTQQTAAFWRQIVDLGPAAPFPGFRLALPVLTVLVGFALWSGGGLERSGWMLGGLAFLPLLAMHPPRRLAAMAQRSWPILLCSAYLCLQLIPSPFQSLAPDATALQLGRVLIYTAVFAAARESVGLQPARAWRFLTPLIVIGCIEAVWGAVYHMLRGEDNYAIGSYAHHSEFACLLGMILPLAVAFGISRRRPAAFLPALLILLGILHSVSRMGLISVVLSLTVMWLLRPARHRYALAIGALLVLAIPTFAPRDLTDRFLRVSSWQVFASEAHLSRWLNTAGLIADRPVFGSGAATFALAYTSVAVPVAGHHPVTSAENDYLQLLEELGFCGAIILLWAAWTAFRPCWTSSRTSLPSLAAIGSIVAILNGAVFDPQFYVPGNVLVLAWIVGVACGVADSAK